MRDPFLFVSVSSITEMVRETKRRTVSAVSRLTAWDNLWPAKPWQQGALRGKVSALANSCTHIYPAADIYGEGGLSPDVTP